MPETTNISDKIKEIESLIEFHQNNADFYNEVKLKAQKAATIHQSTVKSLKKSLAKLKNSSNKINQAETASAEVDDMFYSSSEIEDNSISLDFDDEAVGVKPKEAYDFNND